MPVSKVTAAVLTLAALVVMSGPVAAATPSFNPYEMYDLGANVLSSAVGDVTGDGRPDIVATTGGSIDPANAGKLFVLPQMADGTLPRSGTPQDAANSPHAQDQSTCAGSRPARLAACTDSLDRPDGC